MSRMIFDLTDEDRAALERVRVRMGLRSHAEVLRELIRLKDGEGSAEGAGPPAGLPRSPATAAFGHGRAKTEVGARAREMSEVGGDYPIQIGPAPVAPGSRLKKR